jgi:hypothetical protein
MKFRAAVWCVCFALLTSLAAAAQVTPKVDEREKKQQKRIRDGKKSGELTKKESAKLEAEQAKIHRDEKKAKADGVVTPKERAKLQKEQNKASKDIKKQKHDEQKKP